MHKVTIKKDEYGWYTATLYKRKSILTFSWWEEIDQAYSQYGSKINEYVYINWCSKYQNTTVETKN